MLSLYFICFLPLLVGGYLWTKSNEIVWYEWLSAVAISLVTVGIMHGICYSVLVSDQQVISGYLNKTVYHPRWIEEYQESHTMCSGSGKSQHCTTYYTTEHRTHERYWSVEDTLKETYQVSQNKYDEVTSYFDSPTETVNAGHVGFDGGDPNEYITDNVKLFLDYPTSKNIPWDNIIKATQSNFSFSKITDKSKLFEYPLTTNPFVSKRLLGEAKKDFTFHKLDVLNAKLGQVKKVNIILAGFGKLDKETAMEQEAYWIGGKKNDLVVCYGSNGNHKANWVYVFGWTEDQAVKRNLETLLLKNTLNDRLMDKMSEEIVKNYQIKDFSKFNYLTINPPLWCFVVTLLILVLTQILVWQCFLNNDASKEYRW